MDKFQANPNITDVEIRLECLRLAVEFGPEVQRQNPIKTADLYFGWINQNSKRKLCKCKTSKDKV